MSVRFGGYKRVVTIVALALLSMHVGVARVDTDSYMQVWLGWN